MRKRQALSRSALPLTSQSAALLRSTAMQDSSTITPTCLWALWNVCFSHSWPSRMWKVLWLMLFLIFAVEINREIRESERSWKKGAKWRGTHEWVGDRLMLWMSLRSIEDIDRMCYEVHTNTRTDWCSDQQERQIEIERDKGVLMSRNLRLGMLIDALIAASSIRIKSSESACN